MAKTLETETEHAEIVDLEQDVAGQRYGLYIVARAHLDYLLATKASAKEKRAIIEACYGLLVALDADPLPGGYIRSIEVSAIQRQIHRARAMFGDVIAR